MSKKYIVDLTEVEQKLLKKLTTTGKHAAYKINHARILLFADVNQPDGGWSDQAISKALNISTSTIERVRQRFVESGIDATLSYRPGRGRKQKCLDGESEAHLLAIACSEAPQGRERWTLRMLADQMVELNYVKSLSHETVRQTLKKMKSNLGKKIAG
jgi:transposase